MTAQTQVMPDILFWPLIIACAGVSAYLLYCLVERWEIIQEQLRRRPLPLVGGLATLLLLGWLGWQYRTWMDLSRDPNQAERVRAETEAVKTLAQVLGGGILLYGIYLTLRRIRALERQVEKSRGQLETAQEGQVTERFTRAIEQLGSDKMEVRLGGIYALERISKDSDRDYWTIMEVLTAFIRENAPWPPRPPQADPVPPPAEARAAAAEPGVGEETPAASAPPKPKPPTDIQAALTVLRRRQRRPDEPPLDLRNTDLRGVGLREAHLERAMLEETHLEGANLLWAHLEGAYLSEAHLEGAYLGETHLEGAKFIGAHLEGADLSGAHLEGADLTGATGLTWEQLEQAIIDDHTKLPDYLLKEKEKKLKNSLPTAGEGPEEPQNPAGGGAG